MGSLSGFRPPQFSEDDAYVPAWLQHCNFDQLNVEGLEKDHITFEQRLEKGISDGESLREEGECHIGQLFISETYSSAFNYAQSDNKGIQCRLYLSTNGDSEETDLTTDARQTKSTCPLATQSLQDSGILGQGDVNLSLFRNSGAENSSPIVEFERPIIMKTELSKRNENMNFFEASDDVVELCIAASEALTINEVIENDSFAKSCSASAILEASLHVKQARLEVWKNTFSGSTHVTSDLDNLSDLDDVTMESAFEDAGIHLNESNVSLVKDTFNSDYDENFKHEKTDNYAHTMKDIQLTQDLAAECFEGDTQNKLIGNTECRVVGADVSYEDHCLKTVDTHVELRLSVSAERANATTAVTILHESNMSCQGVDNSRSNIVNEQFKSRWFGGWTSNSSFHTPQNEVKYTTVKHSIPEPFACETSFLSESADDAPDENSFVKNPDKVAIIDSQLSVPNENFDNRATDHEILLSQDVRSSNTSFVDPSCSVVPCSISENICSSPAVNYKDNINPGHFDITIECKTGNVLIDNNQVVAEVSNKENNTDTLYNLMNHRRESHLWASNSTDNEENPVQTALPDPFSEKLKPTLLRNRTQSAQKLRSSKRAHFCEKEMEILEKKKLRKVQTASKSCLSTIASNKSTKSSAHLKNQLDKEKKRLIFQNMEFLLTGFSQKKEKEFEGLIRKYGGVVLSQLPSTNLKRISSRFKSRVLPIVLCLKKIQSFKFLYGCAVNAYVLKVNWLTDSIKAGFVLPPKRYMILLRNISRRLDQVYTAVSYNTSSLVFNNLGVMLYGKTKYFTNIATIIKHGGGQVFRTPQRLVQARESGTISMGVIVFHDDKFTSRHFKHCALEQNIPIKSVEWIIKSLYARKLISLEEKNISRSRPAIKSQRHQDSMELSQEL